MGLYSGGLIIGRIFASEIWGGAYLLGGVFFGGGAYYRNFTVCSLYLCNFVLAIGRRLQPDLMMRQHVRRETQDFWLPYVTSGMSTSSLHIRSLVRSGSR